MNMRLVCYQFKVVNTIAHIAVHGFFSWSNNRKYIFLSETFYYSLFSAYTLLFPTS
jgi:hypothetical protein